MNKMWLTTLVVAATVLLVPALQPVAIGESLGQAALPTTSQFEDIFGTIIDFCYGIPLCGPMIGDLLLSMMGGFGGDMFAGPAQFEDIQPIVSMILPIVSLCCTICCMPVSLIMSIVPAICCGISSLILGFIPAACTLPCLCCSPCFGCCPLGINKCIGLAVAPIIGCCFGYVGVPVLLLAFGLGLIVLTIALAVGAFIVLPELIQLCLFGFDCCSLPFCGCCCNFIPGCVPLCLLGPLSCFGGCFGCCPFWGCGMTFIWDALSRLFTFAIPSLCWSVCCLIGGPIALGTCCAGTVVFGGIALCVFSIIAGWWVYPIGACTLAILACIALALYTIAPGSCLSCCGYCAGCLSGAF